ncbi:MAG TPA: glycosyltransferase family 2 protein [Acidimicrobiales bacterium]|nr:glycosyltransferase family 2 protein [Acidimicrobiales bacterium]
MGLTVAAVVLAYNRKAAVEALLPRLDALPIDEVIVVDNGDDGTDAFVSSWGGKVRLVKPHANLGIAGRNLGAKEATSDLVLFLDDDSYPLPGAIEQLVAILEDHPRVAVVGGYVREVGLDGTIRYSSEPGTFDWWLRAGRTGPAPAGGFPAFFFPEGGSLVRRDAFLAVGGWYEPFFFASVEVELTARLAAAGWEVRYQPSALFDHTKDATARQSDGRVVRMRVRNHIWYLWLRFPLAAAAPRLAWYLFFDLVESTARGAPGAFFGGVADAWRQRSRIKGDRRPIPREVARRVDRGRAVAHLRYLAAMAPRVLRRR